MDSRFIKYLKKDYDKDFISNLDFDIILSNLKVDDYNESHIMTKREYQMTSIMIYEHVGIDTKMMMNDFNIEYY